MLSLTSYKFLQILQKMVRKQVRKDHKRQTTPLDSSGVVFLFVLFKIVLQNFIILKFIKKLLSYFSFFLCSIVNL